MSDLHPTDPVPGVHIAAGAADWQIFSRDDDGAATIHLSGVARPARISPEPPFSFTSTSPDGVAVSARVVSESDGGAVVPWSRTACAADLTWEIDLRVPAGGTYRIETQLHQDGGDGYTLTRGDVVRHVGVGDVYLVLGQSNAAGRARDQIEDEPRIGVHQYRADGTWGLAAHPLNDPRGAVHRGHVENHNTGHSPMLHFAKRLQRETGVPVGLVVAAFGGAPLRWWVEGGNLAPLSNNAVDMIEASGATPRAVLWYQGEADCFELTVDDYAERFGIFVTRLRERVGDPALPFFTVQLNRCTMEVEDPSAQDRAWGMLREQQRRAAHSFPGVHVVPSGDLPLYDFIHLSSAANLAVGERLADAVGAELFDGARAWRAPEPVDVRRGGDRVVELEFAPILNWINDYGLPASRCPFDVEDEDGVCRVVGWRVDGDRVTLELDRDPGPGAVAHGMWRMDHGGVIPADCTRLPFLSFFAVPIR
ncbi:sialate O-acetylesterase [Microbacterium sp.]|uniref:sialate O-acetylesterase n=1 Tax=Microbacterium sp. TaxID=51671 RepID=UPI000928787B|nr:sialate O-acetylesterase [Microbacterium sp.]MBN9190609.1 hypothetical protein [Microbacterium sp.]MBN9193008.1 hypothetical protein [Microbacterium sp.]OJU61350.1 MAG: hypothetical protein BGO04_10640 [Microbacterium sp. 70-38]